MRVLFQIFTLFSILLLSTNICAQNFNSKPYTVSQIWMKGNLSPSEIKQAVPEGYELVSDDEQMLVFEKSLGSRIYDIKVLYDKNKISSVVFTLHSDKVWSLMGEIDELNYEKIDNEFFKQGAIESESYNSSIKPFILVWVTNDNKRTITGFVNRKY